MQSIVAYVVLCLLKVTSLWFGPNSVTNPGEVKNKKQHLLQKISFAVINENYESFLFSISDLFYQILQCEEHINCSSVGAVPSLNVRQFLLNFLVPQY